MNIVTAYKIGFFLTIFLNMLGAFFKISHYPHASLLLLMGIITNLVFVILGLIQVFKNNNFKTNEKIMWTMGFIFLPWIAGLLFYPKFKE
jgi:hypothetical protein